MNCQGDERTSERQVSLASGRLGVELFVKVELINILPTPSFAMGFISFPLHVLNVQRIVKLYVPCYHVWSGLVSPHFGSYDLHHC